MSRKRVAWVAVLVVATAAAGAAYVWAQNRAPSQAPSQVPSQAPSQAQAPSPPAGNARGGGIATPVIAEAAKRMDVPSYLDGVGTVQAYNSVTVRTQVEGRLIQVAFREGQEVKRGDLLARIDPTVYKAQLDQAEAKLAQDTAQLANAKLDLARYTKLAETNYTTRQQADTQRATVAQLEAQLRSDQAVVDNARAVLGYTTIAAPIDGRTGLRLVDEGNIVQPSDASGLVVVTQLKPISVVFSLPQQHLRAVNAAFARARPEAVVTNDDGRSPLDQGTLEVIDNQIDQTTGTVKMKATFPNAELRLWPGQFVNVRLLVRTLKDVVVVPSAAVQRGPDGPFVYVVEGEDHAKLRKVTVGSQDDVQAVIAQNLEAGERVITTGFARLYDGARIAVSEAAGQTPAERPQRPAGRPGGQRQRSQGPPS